MPIFDHDGTTMYEIGRIADHNGTEQHTIGKVYDHDGTTMHLIYSAEEVVFPGYNFTLRYSHSNTNNAITDSKMVVRATPGNDGRQATCSLVYAPVDFTGFNTLTIVWSTPYVGGYGYLCIGYTEAGNGESSFSTVTVSNANLSTSHNRPLVTGQRVGTGGGTTTSATSGTLTLDISGLSGTYEVGMAAVSRTTSGGHWIGGEITSIILT